MQEKSSPEFAERLASALTRAGMNAAHLVRITGKSKGYVSELLSGSKSKPSIEICKMFADVLGCSLSWLYNGEASDEPGSAKIAEREAKPKDPAIGESSNVMREESPAFRVRPPSEMTIEERLTRVENLVERLARGHEDVARMIRESLGG